MTPREMDELEDEVYAAFVRSMVEEAEAAARRKR